MIAPQTYAEELNEVFPNSKLTAISKYGCCAFVLLWCLGIEPDHDIDAIKTVARLMDKGAITDTCTVKWAEAIKALSGRSLKKIEFVDTKVISNIQERTPVRYDWNGKCHWVGVENGKIAFNPLRYSYCVEKGAPASKRVITLAKEK